MSYLIVLGPLDLNLIHLNQVVRNITAVAGAGNLLGNPACAVANLLNGESLTGILDQLVSDLNAMLAALSWRDSCGRAFRAPP
jgi:hypothetical protein